MCVQVVCIARDWHETEKMSLPEMYKDLNWKFLYRNTGNPNLATVYSFWVGESIIRRAAELTQTSSQKVSPNFVGIKRLAKGTKLFEHKALICYARKGEFE